MKSIICILGLLIIIGCTSNPNNIKVGMNVTNGYCEGQVSDVVGNTANILNAQCGRYMYSIVRVPLSDLKEIK